MTVKLSEEYRATVEEVAAKSGLPIDLLACLLDLEVQYPNLHAYGARPAMRRSITELLEQQFAQIAQDDKPSK